MKEEIINNLGNLFVEIASIFKINASGYTFQNRKNYIEELRIKDDSLTKAFEKLINDLDAYSFTRTDKELRFKAPDIYQMELNRIKKDIVESKSNLKSFFDDDYIIGLIDRVDDI